MNTVHLDNSSRSVSLQPEPRTAIIEKTERVVMLSDSSRTVDVFMTYTLEEYYFLSPYQVTHELTEGEIS